MLGPHQISTAIQAVRFSFKPMLRPEDALQSSDEMRRLAVQAALDQLTVEIAKRLPLADRQAFLEAAKRQF
jgi:hypothetical protein